MTETTTNIEKQADTNYDKKTLVCGVIASTLATALLLYVFLIPSILNTQHQGFAIFGIFGLFCGITGSLLPLFKDLSTKIKGIRLISITTLQIATVAWLITSIAYIAVQLSFAGITSAIVSFIITSLYLSAAIYKIKSDIDDTPELEQAIDI